jgi:glucan phosphoethanolaminetransferase (alkaline phosphatase superfamily)
VSPAGAHEILEKILIMSLFIIVIPGLSAITILFFKNRSLQKRLVRFLIIVVIAFIFVSCLYAYVIITKYNSEIVPGFKMVIPLLQLVFSVLAYRGIIKDDKLVKSYDRLR